MMKNKIYLYKYFNKNNYFNDFIPINNIWREIKEKYAL